MGGQRALIRGAMSGPVSYSTHFVLLGGAALGLAAAGPQARPHGLLEAFGLFGALHAAAIALSVRGPFTVARRCLFVLMSAGLSMLTVAMMLKIGYLASLPGFTGVAVLVSSSSGAGAAGYAVLIRRFWLDDLSLASIVAITAGCMAAMLAALLWALYVHTLSPFAFALVWWLALSAGLWCRDGLSRR